MPDYEFDVFLSYETDRLVTRWLVEEFLPHFGTYLRQELAARNNRRPMKIFFAYRQEDFPEWPPEYKFIVEGIPLGMNWEPTLNSAIKASRCMVGIWGPTYFQSDICNREWYSFLRRAAATGRRTVFGASWHDGNSFPADAQGLQMINLSKFALLSGDSLRGVRSYQQFLTAVQLLARNVADAVSQAPAFQDWPIDNGPTPGPAPDIQLTRL